MIRILTGVKVRHAPGAAILRQKTASKGSKGKGESHFSRALRALSDGAGHARCGCHRHAARRRELSDVVPRRVPLLSVDVLHNVVLHILLQLHVLLAALTIMAIMFCCLEAPWLASSSS